MNKRCYSFDWQENSGYEEIEALCPKSVETGILSISRETVKKTNYKKFISENTSRNTVSQFFGLRIAQSGTNNRRRYL
ncbi:MAG: hypothetical protein QHH06_15490 [Clostridiales bacterium]|jgi:hypothetical protein|nr:hypothetical protein [Eubacteriales bacterium]MDH7567839.1 hypothetical protein [Clostridiales bacterium]